MTCADHWGCEIERDLRARLTAVEDLCDEPDHGLFCASHYNSKPCDCWVRQVRAAARGETP